jgi:probable FeS assembly SUF system protein SufT
MPDSTSTTDGYFALLRAVNAIQIPHGTNVLLDAGTQVSITQALGGSFTVVAAGHGGLFRVSGADADALGRESLESSPTSDGEFAEEKVWEQLRNCYDPEIPVNIVDLGLIYSVEITDSEHGKAVAVGMTLTAPGCGMGPALAADAEQRILSVPGVAVARVELVWDPPWSPDRISPAGRARLGMD